MKLELLTTVAAAQDHADTASKNLDQLRALLAKNTADLAAAKNTAQNLAADQAESEVDRLLAGLSPVDAKAAKAAEAAAAEVHRLSRLDEVLRDRLEKSKSAAIVEIEALEKIRQVEHMPMLVAAFDAEVKKAAGTLRGLLQLGHALKASSLNIGRWLDGFNVEGLVGFPYHHVIREGYFRTAAGMPIDPGTSPALQDLADIAGRPQAAIRAARAALAGPQPAPAPSMQFEPYVPSPGLDVLAKGKWSDMGPRAIGAVA
jgi:hypothetical protein